MKFIELSLANKNIGFKEFKIVIFELKKFKYMNKVIIGLRKNRIENNCINSLFNNLLGVK